MGRDARVCSSSCHLWVRGARECGTLGIVSLWVSESSIPARGIRRELTERTLIGQSPEIHVKPNSESIGRCLCPDVSSDSGVFLVQQRELVHGRRVVANDGCGSDILSSG